MMAQEIDASLVLDQATLTLVGIDEIAATSSAEFTIDTNYALTVGLLLSLLGITAVLLIVNSRTGIVLNTGTMKTRVWRLGAAIIQGGSAAWRCSTSHRRDVLIVGTRGV